MENRLDEVDIRFSFIVKKIFNIIDDYITQMDDRCNCTRENE
jgi:hypothetical protein